MTNKRTARGASRPDLLPASVNNLFRASALLVVIVACAWSAFAQEVRPPEPVVTNQGDQQEQSPPSNAAGECASPEAKPAKTKKLSGPGAIVVAPLPISSPAVGSGIVPILGYIFPFNAKDEVSPPSVIGVAGVITNNGSQGFVAGGQLYLKEDTYRITIGFGRAELNYGIYGSGIVAGLKLPLNQTGQAFLAEFLRRIGRKFFAGPRFETANSRISLNRNNVNNFPNPPDIGIHTTLTAVGAELNRDTRPNRFYPISGTYFSFTADFFPKR
jgi:hypothetical protein